MPRLTFDIDDLHFMNFSEFLTTNAAVKIFAIGHLDKKPVM